MPDDDGLLVDVQDVVDMAAELLPGEGLQCEPPVASCEHRNRNEPPLCELLEKAGDEARPPGPGPPLYHRNCRFRAAADPVGERCACRAPDDRRLTPRPLDEPARPGTRQLAVALQHPLELEAEDPRVVRGR